MTLEEENRKLKEDKQKLVKALQDIINGCIHPDTAFRRMMLDLKPIRDVLKEVNDSHD